MVLVVEGYEDCTKPLALVKKFFDAKVVTVLNKHERGIKYPGATIKNPLLSHSRLLQPTRPALHKTCN